MNNEEAKTPERPTCNHVGTYPRGQCVREIGHQPPHENVNGVKWESK